MSDLCKQFQLFFSNPFFGCLQFQSFYSANLFYWLTKIRNSYCPYIRGTLSVQTVNHVRSKRKNMRRKGTIPHKLAKVGFSRNTISRNECDGNLWATVTELKRNTYNNNRFD